MTTTSRARKAPAKKAAAKKAPAAVAARQDEAEDGFVTVDYLDIALKIPVAGKVPVAAIDLFRAGDKYGGTKAMVGAEQWQLLSDAGMTREGLDELGRKITAALGN